MDVLTQGLLGGVLAQAVARKEEKKLATFVGVMAGLLADADFFIRSSQDPLLNIEFHRHFSHSLIFIPVGAAIACALLWPFLRRHIATGRLYLFCLAGYSMSGILDACTSYGTQLLWPFSDVRVAFNIISMLVMVVTDKQSDIAILKTMGARTGTIMRVFIVQGSLIGVIGTVLGVIGGILLAQNIGAVVPLLERFFGFSLFPADIYYITELPSDLRESDVVKFAAMSLGMALISTLYPAWRASRTHPAEALRYE